MDAGDGAQGMARVRLGADWMESRGFRLGERRTGRRYSEVVSAATHNSFAGMPSGDLGSVRRQLDGGVRFVELDVHDDAFASSGYRIGHDEPGNRVVQGGGNPRTDSLAAWLRTVATWSAGNPRHAPIVVALDLKDDLTDNRSFAQGNLARVNAELLDRLPGLFTADELGNQPWPTIDALSGRLIAVLSGTLKTRLGYLRDPGHNPAVALNAAGHLVEVHDSGDGDLWYWTGELVSPNRVRWRRHGHYDTGQRPAIALDDDGLVVEVHEDPDPGDDRLWYRVARLTPEFELEWSARAGRSFPDADEGVNPSVRFVDPAAKLVREVHQSEQTGRNWYWNGRWRPSDGSIAWTRDDADGGETHDPLFDKARAVSGRREVGVRSGSDRDTLLYTAGSAGPRPIRYWQIAFVEVQRDDGRSLEGTWFFAATAKDAGARRWAENRRREGKLVRLWEFNDPRFATNPPPSFPATDHPAAGWYREYCAALGAVA
jgi:hypothetical protein